MTSPLLTVLCTLLLLLLLLLALALLLLLLACCLLSEEEEELDSAMLRRLRCKGERTRRLRWEDGIGRDRTRVTSLGVMLAPCWHFA